MEELTIRETLVSIIDRTSDEIGAGDCIRIVDRPWVVYVISDLRILWCNRRVKCTLITYQTPLTQILFHSGIFFMWLKTFCMLVKPSEPICRVKFCLGPTGSFVFTVMNIKIPPVEVSVISRVDPTVHSRPMKIRQEYNMLVPRTQRT